MVACSICSVLCQKQERSVQLLYVIVVFPILFSEGFVVDSTRLFHVFACVVFVPFVLVFVHVESLVHAFCVVSNVFACFGVVFLMVDEFSIVFVCIVCAFCVCIVCVCVRRDKLKHFLLELVSASCFQRDYFMFFAAPSKH